MNKTITLTNEQWAALQSGEAITISPPKPMVATWEPKSGNYYITANGTYTYYSTTYSTKKFGNTFETKEQAEAAAKAMCARNRLAAYVQEFAPDWKADWSNFAQLKYSVHYLHNEASWGLGRVSFSESPERVYMPEHVAAELVRKLNSGEVVL